jgi:riboflavin kinase
MVMTCDDVLLFLIKKNAHKRLLRISTAELGSALGMSQQNASRRLIKLEKDGKIERKGSEVRITKAGLDEIKTLYFDLKKILEEKETKLEFEGTIVEGLHEGAYYVKKYATRIKKALGFEPFPGTLNIKLDSVSIEKRAQLMALDPIIIKGFRKGGRSFGDIFAYRCKICGVDGAVIIPLRTHHDISILEIISEKNLLRACKKTIGEKVRVSIT